MPAAAQEAANLVLRLFQLTALRERADEMVFGIGVKIAKGAVGDENIAIIRAVPEKSLEFVQRSDHFERVAIDDDLLADRVFILKELLDDARGNDSNVAPMQVVGRGQKAAIGQRRV